MKRADQIVAIVELCARQCKLLCTWCMKRSDQIVAIVAGSLFLGVCAGLVKSGALPLGKEGGGFNWDSLGVIFAAAMTFAIYSFLYKDNPFFRAVENLFVGLGLGVTVYFTWFQFFKPEIYDRFLVPAFSPKLEIYPRDYWLLLPCVLGLMMLTRISSKYSWISRWPVAFLVGYWSGYGLQPTISSYILKQAHATMKPVVMSGVVWACCGVAAAAAIVCAYLSSRTNRAGLAARVVGVAMIAGYVVSKGYAPFAEATVGVDALLLVLGVISVLVYFFFSAEHKGVVGGVSKVGIWFLMMSFGASFGYTVMARESLLIGRIQFLLFEWLKLPQP